MFMNRWSAAVCFSVLLTSPSFSQQYVASPYWQPFVAIGYWYGPSDLNDYYSTVLDYYRASGIPVPLQMRFGRTFSIEAGLLFSRIAPIQVGVSVGFRFTPAYSDYEDFAGVLKIDGAMYTYSVSLGMSDILMNLWGLPLILTLEPGITRSSVAITNELRFSNQPQSNDTEEWDGHAWGFQFRFLLGTSVPVGPLMASLHVGYQKGVAAVTDGSTASNGWMINGYGPIHLDQEGPIILIRIGIKL